MFALIDKLRLKVTFARLEKGKTATRLDYYLNRALPVPKREGEVFKSTDPSSNWEQKKADYTLRPSVLRMNKSLKYAPMPDTSDMKPPKRVTPWGNPPTYENPYPNAAEELFL